MNKLCSFLVLSATLATSAQCFANTANEQVPKLEAFSKDLAPFHAFTGKITKNKVRMRLNPALDSPVIKQLDQGELLIVIGEDDEFYMVQPPENLQAYVFRTYVLDGVIEGNGVNVRLEPLLDSPIIAKLNSGDTVSGRISSTNNKWLEIAPPSSTKFYVSKDYVEKIGDSNYLTKYNQRKTTVNTLLESASTLVHENVDAPFQQIDYQAITAKLQGIVDEFPDFEVQATQASELLNSFKEDYTKKKIAYLEDTSKQLNHVQSLEQENSRLSKAILHKQQKLKELDSKVQTKNPLVDYELVSQWSPQEEIAYEEWLYDNPNGNKDDFYIDENLKSSVLKGKLEHYKKDVKNKPGDYVLINSSNTPIAFLYSTKLDLENFVGQNITITGANRPNNNFAYPAFNVLTIK